MVKVATQGRPVVRDIQHREGMNVEDVLNEAEMAANEGQTITVNSLKADPKTPVPNESVVVVTSKVTNG